MTNSALVTDGAGFIGSHLSDLLIRQNWAVRVVDNLSTGSMGNIHHLLGNKRFEFARSNIRNSKTLSTITTGTDTIFTSRHTPKAARHLQIFQCKMVTINSIWTISAT